MRMLGKEKAYAQSNAYKKLSFARKTLLQGPLLDLKLSDLRVFAIIQNAEERTLYAAEKKGCAHWLENGIRKLGSRYSHPGKRMRAGCPRVLTRWPLHVRASAPAR